MKIINTWYHKGMPQYNVLQLPNGELHKYPVDLRRMSEQDLTVYLGAHPAKTGQIEVPHYMWRFYGLER